MEPFRVFATLETDQTLLAWQTLFSRKGWRTVGGQTKISLESDGFVASLEESEQGLLILRGELTEWNVLAQLTALLRDHQARFQIDIFEEDGRLLRRLTDSTSAS